MLLDDMYEFESISASAKFNSPIVGNKFAEAKQMLQDLNSLESCESTRPIEN